MSAQTPRTDKERTDALWDSVSTPTVVWSSPQDPKSWTPNVDFGPATIVTCISNGDAKKAETLFNSLLDELAAAHAKIAELERDGMVLVPEETLLQWGETLCFDGQVGAKSVAQQISQHLIAAASKEKS